MSLSIILSQSTILQLVCCDLEVYSSLSILSKEIHKIVDRHFDFFYQTENYNKQVRFGNYDCFKTLYKGLLNSIGDNACIYDVCIKEKIDRDYFILDIGDKKQPFEFLEIKKVCNAWAKKGELFRENNKPQIVCKEITTATKTCYYFREKFAFVVRKFHSSILSIEWYVYLPSQDRYVLHNDCGPAVIKRNGSVLEIKYYKYKILHNEAGPSLFITEKAENFTFARVKSYLKDYFFSEENLRIDGLHFFVSAIPVSPPKRKVKYHMNGLLHRNEDLPTSIEKNADFCEIRYYKHGQISRNSGPAIIKYIKHPKGMILEKKWFVDGEEMSYKIESLNILETTFFLNISTGKDHKVTYVSEGKLNLPELNINECSFSEFFYSVSGVKVQKLIGGDFDYLSSRPDLGILNLYPYEGTIESILKDIEGYIGEVKLGFKNGDLVEL